MKELLDRLIAQGSFPGVPTQIVYAGGIVLVAAIVIFGFVLNVAGVTTFVERRVWARIQSRIGPNRVGPQGILQWLAGGNTRLVGERTGPGRGGGAPCE